MLSRPICAGLGVSIDVDDCIYRCFEAYHRRVLQRRAARKAQKKKQQSKYQQSFYTEQHQNIPPQPSIPSSYYPNIIQDSSRYQTLLEPTNITAPIQTFQYSNINQSTTSPIETSYQSQIIDTPEPYHQLRQVQYPSYSNIIDQNQISAEFQKSQDIYIPPSTSISYTNENTTQYQTPISRVYDSSVTDQVTVGSSIPTGTIEYTKQAYFSQEPLSTQPTTTSYVQQIQSSDNQQYIDNQLPPETVQTYDQNIYTNEQIAPQQLSYEENEQNLFQQTSANQSLPPVPVAEEIYQQQESIAINPPSDSFIPTVPSQQLPSPTPSDTGSEDAREDEDIFNLRACICQCYAKCKGVWITDQQNIQQIQQPIPISIPPYIQPSIPLPFYDYPKPEQPIYKRIIPVPPSPQYLPPVPIFPQIPIEQPPAQFVPPLIQQYIPPPPQYLPPVPIPPQIPIEQPPAQFVPPLIQQYIPPPPQYLPPVPIPPQIPIEQPPAQFVPPLIQQYIPPPPQYLPPVPIPPQIPIEQLQIPCIPVPATISPPEIHQSFPRFDRKTGLCLVPCPETIKYAHLPPNLRPELFCVELPPASLLPPPPPPPSPPLPPSPVPIHHDQRWCVRCCCVPGRSLIKKIVYRQIEEEKQQQEEDSYIDYGSVIDQLETKITVRYGNSIMEEGDVYGTYNEQLRIIDFPVYISGLNDANLTQLVPDT